MPGDLQGVVHAPSWIAPFGGPSGLLMHNWSLVHRDDAFGCRRSVAEGALRSCGVVVLASLFDDDLGLPKSVEDLLIQKLIAQASVEALAVAVLPG